MANNHIHYFRDCYLSDNRESGILNVFSKSFDKCFFPGGKEELINQELPYRGIEESKAKAIEAELALHEKEKELLYGAFLICGKTKVLGKEQNICAPLFLYPAEIFSKDGYYYFRIELENWRINTPVLHHLKGEKSNDAFLETIYNHLPKGKIEFGDVRIIQAAFAKAESAANINDLLLFPKLSSQRLLRRLPKELDDEKKIVTGGVLGIMSKSTQTRGILNELTAVAKATTLSKPLTYLLGDKLQTEPLNIDSGHIPTLLNNDQKKVIGSLQQHTNVLMVGPPGTGKSFTIAAIALEYISKSKSILVVSRSNTAVDVVGNKIEELLPRKSMVIRAGKSSYQRSLRKTLKNLLHGITPRPNNLDATLLNRNKESLQKEIKVLELQIAEIIEKETEWGRYLFEHQNGSVWSEIKKKYIGYKTKKQIAHWELMSKYQSAINKYQWVMKQLLSHKYTENLQYVLSHHRKEFSTLLDALKAKADMQQERFFSEIDFHQILKAFPIWLVNSEDMNKALPLQRELFDLVIIDEASQCDIASVLPAIYRGRQLLVSGDPNQLRHLSFLPRNRMNDLLKKHMINEINHERFNYRDNSIFDLCSGSISDQNAVNFLSEHYRSIPAIISYSNRRFYKNSLRLMRERPGPEVFGSISIIKAKGKRTESGENVQEANAILTSLKAIIDSQQHLDKALVYSIGVLSPFRAQTNYLTKRIKEEIAIEDIKKHKLMVGTAHSFQGEERDIMHLSFAIDNESHPSSFNHLNKEDIFNVSITRAKNHQYIYTSLNRDGAPSNNLLCDYIAEIEAYNKSTRDKHNQAADKFAHEVKSALSNTYSTIWEGYPVAGLKVDLVVKHLNIFTAIDLIGYPGEFEEAFTMERYNILHRTGLRIFPLPYTYWVIDNDKCIQNLHKFIQLS